MKKILVAVFVPYFGVIVFADIKNYDDSNLGWLGSGK